jgi:tetratricopeptide (TPR) repeat protein
VDTLPELKNALGRVVFLKLDAEKGEGKELAKEYNIEGYPTFLLANAKGETVERWWGYGEAAEFIATLDSGVKDPTTIDQKRARFESNPNMNDAAKLATFYETQEDFHSSVEWYQRAQALRGSSDKDFRYEIFQNTTWGVYQDDFKTVDAKKAADAALAFEGRSVEDVANIAGMMTSLGRKKDDATIMVPYLELAMRETEGVDDESIQKKRTRLQVDHALFVEHDEAKAVSYKKATYDEGWMEDADSLNGFAWWCFETNVNLEEADALARKGVELADNGKSKAMILDTVAEICNARGSCKDAVFFIELAIQEDPDSEYYPKQLERFRKLLAEQSGETGESGE